MSAVSYSMTDEVGCIRDLQKTYVFDDMPRLRANVRRRRKREFTPDEQKDSNYWLKRTRNNEAAKGAASEKLMEHLLETRAVELQRENEHLKVALSAANHHNTGLKNHMDFAQYHLSMPNDASPRRLRVPTALHCPFSDRCGSMYAEASNCSSVYDLALCYGQENLVNSAKLYSHETNTCASKVYPSNRGFAYENDASQVLTGLPQYSSPVVNLSCNSRCYNARTSSSETTQNCTRQPGLVGDIHEVPKQTNASEETCQQQPITQSVLLPHKLRYKADNARFVAKCHS